MQPCQNCGQPHNGPCAQPHAKQPVNPFAEVSPRVQLRSGQVLQGRYEILHVLGQGGMGTVFMARDLRLNGRSCVVKKLRDDFYREEDRQKAAAFFEREMQVLSELRHPHIVQILDFFAEDADYYLIMEYVQGSNLHAMLHDERRGEPFAEKDVVSWVEQICEVLHYLHNQSPPVIYRDLKPSNVMIDMNNTVKLVDFGIARQYEQEGEHTHVVSAGYSPPEQYWGAADPRSDIYSLGATIHFLLSGHDPEALHVCSPKALNAQVSDAIDALVQQATAQDVNERFQSVEEFMEALMHREYVQAPNTPRSHIGELITGVVILALAAIIFLVEPLLQADPHSKTPAARTLSGERDDATIDGNRRAGGSSTASEPVRTGPDTDLAVQVMDERDLTDPEGMTAPAASKQEQGKFNFNLPWMKTTR